jgi:hypothetical protein
VQKRRKQLPRIDSKSGPGRSVKAQHDALDHLEHRMRWLGT